MKHLIMLFIAAVALSSCVGNELRRTSSLTAAEVQSYNTDLNRFDTVHRGIIAEMDRTARENGSIARVSDALVGARVTELRARGNADVVRLYEAATPPIAATESDIAPITPPKWNSGAQETLIKALNEVSAERTTGQSAELLLGFAFDVAKAMKKDAEKAASSTDGK